MVLEPQHDSNRPDPSRTSLCSPLYGGSGGKVGGEREGGKERGGASDREGGDVRQTASVLVMSDHTGSLARCLE